MKPVVVFALCSLLLPVLSGCGSARPELPDACSLLTKEDVRTLEPLVVDYIAEHTGDSTRSRLCRWRDDNGRMLVMLVVSEAGERPPLDVLQRYFGSNARVLERPELARHAAAAFARAADGTEKLQAILATDGVFDINFRAPGVGNEQSSQFATAEKLIRQAFERAAERR